MHVAVLAVIAMCPGACSKPAVPTRIEFHFNESQRAVHRAQLLASGREEFTLAVELDDAAPIAARAHLRGRGSLADCKRKSYSVTLDGSQRMFDRTFEDALLLLSLCEDDRYIQTHFANQLLADFGLYPFRYRYVELVVDAAEAGVYMIVQKPDDVLERSTPHVAAVLRRRFEAGTESFELKSSREGFDSARSLDELQRSLAGLAGTGLESALARQIDLPGFLDWLALMTLLQNGDYVDELWMVASDRSGWTFAAWDNDDLFSECHYGGDFAFEDRHGIAYCVEGSLERRVLADPVLYARFVEALERVMARITPTVVRTALTRTGDALLPHCARPAVCRAMIELLEANPAASDCEEAMRDIRRHLDRLGDKLEERRALLARKIAAYRGARK